MVPNLFNGKSLPLETSYASSRLCVKFWVYHRTEVSKLIHLPASWSIHSFWVSVFRHFNDKYLYVSTKALTQAQTRQQHLYVIQANTAKHF